MKRLWAFPKLTKFCAHELTLLVSLQLPPALPLEKVAENVDESKVQNHNGSKCTEAANLLGSQKR
jgi:hypothetical protein